ncbi:GH92 family glycosyl hydrolase [Arenibacter palladensis]|uniref:GH92 family glycosyl hydrolase n=1 Tax=Arenibacter palladensis TaxID=237373 RepID=UPI0026E409E1|nr:GH92 family glycosyl hydrolase [Arenibacter palladensis]MDO6605319.1 GH92 family glycosyl hydrolase [Arenibacter palladensis]
MLNYSRFYLRTIFICLLTALISNLGFCQESVIWQIGKSDNSSAEFALASNEFEKFLEKDFGWEDKYYMIGYSKEGNDFPFVLPGAIDYWGGTSGLAGIRPHEINILFGIKSKPKKGDWRLIIDVLDCNPESPPYLKILVNGKTWKFKLKNGHNAEVLKGEIINTKEQQITIPIEAELLKNGGNIIQLTTLEGSWLVFDQVRLEGPSNTSLIQPKNIFIRNVAPAQYELEANGARIQPLLLDVQHLQGNSKLSVTLDGKSIFQEVVEHGRNIYEVPMMAVDNSVRSSYSVFIDGKLMEKGEIERNPQKLNTLANYVDTKIGTGHSRWMIAPGPWMPFSMVKISPDNQNEGWQAGYQPTFESVGAFSHIHEWTMAGLGTFPTNGPLITKVGSQGEPDKGYRSRVDKSTEEAPLGYYSVFLSDYKIRAELTATTRASFQRYTYPKDVPNSRILVDLQIPSEYAYQVLEAHFEKINDYKIVGYSKQKSSGVWGEQYYRSKMVENGDKKRDWDDIEQEYTVHFAMEFDRPIKNFGVWSDGPEKGNIDISTRNNVDQMTLILPEDVVGFVEFDTKDNQVVQTRTGISYVSIDNASLNLEEEIIKPFGWSLTKVRENQEMTWNNLFNRIKVSSNNHLEKTRFYSNMYRALVSRNIYSDVDGSWIDANENVQKFTNSNDVALGCDAFWNTFWNLNQFWNLITPEWSSKWIKSQLAMYDANGWLAKGPAGMEYIPVMVAEHEIPLIVGAYQMGIRDFDAEKAFQAVYKMQTTKGEQVGGGYAGNRDLEAYLKYKYVPYNKGRFSNTLEYSFDDFAVSQLAKSLGKSKEYYEFIDRAYWWKNAIDPETGFARLRHSDSTWFKDFDPIETGGNHQFVEGNAWQLTFFVPQDIPALANIIGKDEFAKRLEDGFMVSSNWRYNAPNEKYWDFPVIQGNQQSMHFSYLFNWVEKPWLTQKWNRDIMSRFYGYGVSNAYLGDEDQGQMSAWFMMSAMGLFQTDGGTRTEPIYEIGSPLFEKIEIDLGNQYNRGNSFVIEAKNTSYNNKYVQSATLNGKELLNFWFPVKELLKGGSLILEMGPKPNLNWGIGSTVPVELDFKTKLNGDE